jgi:DNA repair exonuclease SbcCD ATPase subunit
MCHDLGMDTQTIDQEYAQLQTEFQDVANTIQSLAQKLQTAAQGGDQNAREWLLDLKQVALDVKDEQMQVNNLLQAIHGFVENQNQQLAQMPAYQQAAPMQPQYQQPAGGMFGGFLNGGFGQAMKVGAGLGLGETLINDIFN